MQNNPFVLPGFGQAGPASQNPILASMEMMRQAWEGLASSGGLDAATMGRMMSVEEMDKRIADLRAVENWLRMNLSMLTSTIQGLEVQRATVATLKSFVDTSAASMAGGNDAPRAASPLDEALKAWSSKSDDEPKAAQAEPAQPQAQAQPEAAASSDKDQARAEPESGSTAGQSGAADQNDIMAAAASAAQGWWGLLQQQFQTLAAATAASAEGAMADLAEAGKAASEAGAAVAKAQPARKAPAKTAARSTAAKKTVAKKAAAKKAAPAKSVPAAKKASKKTAAKKTTSARKTAG